MNTLKDKNSTAAVIPRRKPLVCPRDSKEAKTREEEENEREEMQFVFDEGWSTPPKETYMHLMGTFKCKECGSDLVKLNAKRLCGKSRCVKGDISKIYDQ